MKLIKCDRCGAFLTPYERKHASVEIRGQFYVLANGADLCKNCQRGAIEQFRTYEAAFRQWMKNEESQTEEPAEV